MVQNQEVQLRFAGWPHPFEKNDQATANRTACVHQAGQAGQIPGHHHDNLPKNKAIF